MLLCSSGLAFGTARLLSNPRGCLHLCMHFARTSRPHRLGFLPHHPSHTVPTDSPCKIRILTVANNRRAKNMTIPQLTEIDLFQSCQVQRCHQESCSPDFLFSSPLCGSGNLNRFESLQILNGSWLISTFSGGSLSPRESRRGPPFRLPVTTCSLAAVSGLYLLQCRWYLQAGLALHS